MSDQHGYESDPWRGAPQPWAGNTPPQPWFGNAPGEPHPGQQYPAASQPGSRVSVALVIGGVTALVAVLAAVIVLIRSSGPGVVAADPSPPTVTVPAPQTTSEAPRSSTSAPAPPPAAAQPGSGAAPVPLGQRAEVDDYLVAVTSVNLDGDAVVDDANQFNDPPTGRYVIIEVDAQYVGDDEGHVLWDLSYVFNGTDARQYDNFDCGAVLPNGAGDAPTLNPGGSASFQVCMDVPPAAIDGALLFIEPLFSFDDEDRVYFAIR
ncbi:hypothetical protein ACI782_06695 [Geodermatophilus sp. SYSU D00703]